MRRLIALAKKIAGRRQWAALHPGDAAGGLSGAITSMPGNVAIGFVAFSPLGVGAQSSGVGVALLAAAIGGGVFTSVCRTRGLMAGGSMSFALVVAGVLTTLVQQGILQAGLVGVPGALAVVALLTLLTGLCEAALAASGLGQLVTMLPYPVVSGIRNGVALLMILLQLRPMLGLTGSGTALQWTHPAAAVVAAFALVFALRPVRVLRAVPPALLAICAGAGVHYLLAAFLTPRGWAGLLGPLLDVPPGGSQHLRALAAGWAALPSLPVWPLASAVIPGALTIAVVSAMETLVGASVMQDISGEHGSARADLMALAAANVAGGLCGTTPVTGGSPGSMAVWGAGGRGKPAGLIRAAVLLATVLLAGPVIGLLPTAALAGMVVGNGLQLFDRELLRVGRAVFLPGTLGRPETIGNLLVMLAVIGAATIFGLVAAVLTGLLLSTLLFVAAMSGRAVRRHYSSPGSRSRTYRSEGETEALLQHGTEIEVIELHGALFFGSANQIVREIEAAWARGARCVIIDYRRVSQMDLSGARRLLQVSARYWKRGSFLAFAGLRPGSPVWASYDNFGLRPQIRAEYAYPTLEQALAAAELVVLAAYGVERPVSRGTALDVLIHLGIPAAAAASLLAHAPEHAFGAGDVIIRTGEPAGAVYILIEGEVEVRLPLGDDGRYERLASMTSGTLFGEMALLSGVPRSADITALTPVRCLGLEVVTIMQLRQAAPELAYHIMAAIAGQLAHNVLMANAALKSAGE